jgi:hypothetical protein
MCAVLGNCAAYSCNFLSTFQNNLSGTSSRSRNASWISWPLQDGTDNSSRSTGKELPLYAPQCPRRTQISNIVEPDRPQTTIWPMSIACCISKATNTHPIYVIFIALPLQQWLHERASMFVLRTHSCLIRYKKLLHAAGKRNERCP